MVNAPSEEVVSVFNLDYLLGSIFIHVSPFDLARLQRVSKLWAKVANDNSLWCNKYIEAAKLVDHTTPAREYPSGYFKRVYRNRFGRLDGLKFLFEEYKETNNLKYLRQLEDLAIKCYFSRMKTVPALSPITHLLKIDKYIFQRSFYPSLPYISCDFLFTFIATLYSTKNLESIKIRGKFSRGKGSENWRIVQVDALFPGSREVELVGHSAAHAFQGMVPNEKVCDKLLEFTGIKMTNEELIQYFNSICMTIHKVASTERDWDKQIELLYSPMIDICNLRPDKLITMQNSQQMNMRDEEEILWRMGNGSVFASIAAQASGIIREREVLAEAETIVDPRLRKAVVALIGHTKIRSWSTVGGKMQPEIHADYLLPKPDLGLCSLTLCRFQLNFEPADICQICIKLVRSEQSQSSCFSIAVNHSTQDQNTDCRQEGTAIFKHETFTLAKGEIKFEQTEEVVEERKRRKKENEEMDLVENSVITFDLSPIHEILLLPNSKIMPSDFIVFLGLVCDLEYDFVPIRTTAWRVEVEVQPRHSEKQKTYFERQSNGSIEMMKDLSW